MSNVVIDGQEFNISRKTLENIIGYLGKRPFFEVQVLINDLITEMNPKLKEMQKDD